VVVDENLRIGLLPMAVISTATYWHYRGRKIPPAYPLLSDDVPGSSRNTEFYTDIEAVEGAKIGMASRWYTDKYGQAYFANRRSVFQRDNFSCTVCGYKTQRQKGEVHDLEIHHLNPTDGYGTENLQTVCLPCHQQLTAI
jgi:hypothetical protein